MSIAKRLTNVCLDHDNKFWEELIRLFSLRKSFVLELDLMEINLSEFTLTSLNSI
jgi:hypothetical protein